MTEDDKYAFKEFRNGVAFTIAVVAFAMVIIAMITDNSTPVNESSFEVVDKYKECDIVRYAPNQAATYKYFMYCEKNK
jgi:hypothetical protein